MARHLYRTMQLAVRHRLVLAASSAITARPAMQLISYGASAAGSAGEVREEAPWRGWQRRRRCLDPFVQEREMETRVDENTGGREQQKGEVIRWGPPHAD